MKRVYFFQAYCEEQKEDWVNISKLTTTLLKLCSRSVRKEDEQTLKAFFKIMDSLKTNQNACVLKLKKQYRTLGIKSKQAPRIKESSMLIRSISD
ncbi:hypothetical protein M0813_08387 [Anaeramoeba flamelloides]|uniref:Uncharacterized protein n=1 Tax=Anaeramoeba flamelloides TaxID=1746091 RepID=A0ABQ8XBB6_9EUKA|nr:hypothetical protein M0813_08387 [Anaeramoeba flamelloides]